MKNIFLIIFITVLISGGAAFYGGTEYARSVDSRGLEAGFWNLNPEERQQRFRDLQTNAGNSQLEHRTIRGENGFVSGEIIFKDDQSVTVKLPEGGSKIVFLSGETSVTKNATSSVQDLHVGDVITAAGSANEDGSLSAKSVQTGSMAVFGRPSSVSE